MGQLTMPDIVIIKRKIKYKLVLRINSAMALSLQERMALVFDAQRMRWCHKALHLSVLSV